MRKWLVGERSPPACLGRPQESSESRALPAPIILCSFRGAGSARVTYPTAPSRFAVVTPLGHNPPIRWGSRGRLCLGRSVPHAAAQTRRTAGRGPTADAAPGRCQPAVEDKEPAVAV